MKHRIITNSAQRFLAGFINNIIALLIAVSISIAIFYDKSMLALISSVVIYSLYFFILETIYSRTIGKMFLGLIVADKHGSKISWKQALIRTLFRIIDTPLLCFIPEIIGVAENKSGQRFGDRLANTVVKFK